jgi:hypothetical protein
MVDTIKVGDGMVIITLDTEQGEDLAAATKLAIKWRKPDGTKGEYIATESEEEGEEGYITYTAPKTEFLLPGAYKLNSYVEYSADAPHTGTDVFFLVEAV